MRKTHKGNNSNNIKMDNILGDFEIQTDHQISAWRPDLVIINKKKRTCWIVDAAVPADHSVEMKENEKRST